MSHNEKFLEHLGLVILSVVFCVAGVYGWAHWRAWVPRGVIDRFGLVRPLAVEVPKGWTKQDTEAVSRCIKDHLLNLKKIPMHLLNPKGALVAQALEILSGKTCRADELDDEKRKQVLSTIWLDYRELQGTWRLNHEDLRKLSKLPPELQPPAVSPDSQSAQPHTITALRLDTWLRTLHNKPLQTEPREDLKQRENSDLIGGPATPKLPKPSPLPETQQEGVYSVGFRNDCPGHGIFLAASFLDYDNRWVTEGWWHIQPSEQINAFSTRNSIFYYFAFSDDAGPTWNGEGQDGAVTTAVISEPFLYRNGEQIQGKNKRTVSMRMEKMDTTDFLDFLLPLACNYWPPARR